MSEPPPEPSPDAGLIEQYYASGAGDEATLRANTSAWDELWLRPRTLRDVSRVGMDATLLGAAVRTPLVVAPMAFLGLLGHGDERDVAAQAVNAGAVPCLSARSTTPVEHYAPGGPWWQQIYAYRDWSRTLDLAERATAAGAGALVLTVDTPLLPTGRTVPRERLGISELVMLANHPGADSVAALTQSPAVLPAIVAALAAIGPPVIVKGVLRGDDAQRALDHGAAAVWVSNHGGRQLDHALPTAWALPEVRRAVGPDAELVVDGGLASGRSLLVALALGASAVAVGRYAAAGLSEAGPVGVRARLERLQGELAEAMALCGVASIAQITADLVTRQPR